MRNGLFSGESQPSLYSKITQSPFKKSDTQIIYPKPIESISGSRTQAAIGSKSPPGDSDVQPRLRSTTQWTDIIEASDQICS